MRQNALWKSTTSSRSWFRRARARAISVAAAAIAVSVSLGGVTRRSQSESGRRKVKLWKMWNVLIFCASPCQHVLDWFDRGRFVDWVAGQESFTGEWSVSDVSMLEFNYPHHLFKIQLESRFLQKCPKLSKGNITTILHTNTYSALPLITDAKITPSLSAAQENGFHFQRTDVGLRFSGSYIYACNTLLV